MKHHIRLMIVVLLLLMVYGMSSLAQGCASPFAAVAGDQWVYCDGAGELREFARASGYLSSPVWNAAGDKLAFIMSDENYNLSAHVFDTATGETLRLDTPALNAGFPVGWTADGRVLLATYVLDASGEVIFDEITPIDILAIAPVAGARPERLGQSGIRVGCGGGSPVPADPVYWTESEGFSGFFLTLTETPFGILYSATCEGVGGSLLDVATGESVSLDDTLARVVVSPDGNRAAGTVYNPTNGSVRDLVIYDLATAQANTFRISGEPNQIAWSADGTHLYYSQRAPQPELVLTEGQSVAVTAILGYAEDAYPVYAVSIHRLDLATGADDLLFSGDAYAVGRMRAVDGALYFSLVPNMQVMIDVLESGMVNDEDAAGDVLTPRVLRLSLTESGDAQDIGAYGLFTPVQ